MTLGKVISLFLIDGVPDGRIMCDLSNWIGQGYKIPRSMFRESASREELYKAGVYFLFGRDESSVEANTVYIGEAEEVYKRIVQHQNSDFWMEALVFISTNDNLNKAHIKFLEYQIYETASQANRYKLRNTAKPNCPAISEPEQAVMGEFFDNLKLLVGTLGYKLFEPLIKPGIGAVEEYFIKGARGADARAVFTSEGVVVLKGSKVACPLVPSTDDYTIRLRQRLEEQNVIVSEGDRMLFVEDHLFSSPSAAAAVVLGRTANGRIELKDSKGRTLKENEEQ